MTEQLIQTEGSPAERHFPRIRFERIERADVPATVRTAIDFTSACPSSTAAMRKSL